MLTYEHYYGDMGPGVDIYLENSNNTFNFYIEITSGSIRSFINLDVYLRFSNINKYLRIKKKSNNALIYTDEGNGKFSFSNILNYNNYDIYYNDYKIKDFERIYPAEGSSYIQMPDTSTEIKITSKNALLALFTENNIAYPFMTFFSISCIDDAYNNINFPFIIDDINTQYLFHNKFAIVNPSFSIYKKIFFSTDDLNNTTVSNTTDYSIYYYANNSYSSDYYTTILWYKIINSEKNYYYFNGKVISNIESPYTPVLEPGVYDPSYRPSIKDVKFMKEKTVYVSGSTSQQLFSLLFNTINNLKSFYKAEKIIFKVSIYNETSENVFNKIKNYAFNTLSTPVEEYISSEYDLAQLDVNLSNYSCATYITQNNNNIQKDYYSQESNNYKFNLQYKNNLTNLNIPVDNIDIYLYGGNTMQEEEYKKLQYLKNSSNFIKPFYQRWHELTPYSTQTINSTSFTKTWHNYNSTRSTSVTFSLKTYKKEYHYYLSDEEKFVLNCLGALPEVSLFLIANNASLLYKAKCSYKNSGEYLNFILNNGHFKLKFKEIDFDYIKITETYEECYQWQPGPPYYKVINPTENELYYKLFFQDSLDQVLILNEIEGAANSIITKRNKILIPGNFLSLEMTEADLGGDLGVDLMDVLIEENQKIPIEKIEQEIGEEIDKDYSCNLQFEFIKNGQPINVSNDDIKITYRNIYLYPELYYYIQYPLLQDSLQKIVNISNLKQTHTGQTLYNPGDSWLLVTDNYILKKINEMFSFSRSLPIAASLKDFQTTSAILTINDSNNSYFNINETSVSVGPNNDILENSRKKFEVNANYDAYFNGKTNIFPIGSIYLSLSPQNPSAYFIGEWVSFGQGRTLIGATDTKETNPEWIKWWKGENTASIEPEQYISGKYTEAGLTGGEETHTLTINEMPSHTHTFKNTKAGGSGSARWVIDAGSSSTGNTASTGGGQAHNNMPPYITCYMWLRIA